MLRSLILSAIFLFLAANTAHAIGSEDVERLMAAETAKIGLAKGRAQRVGDTLILHMINGATTIRRRNEMLCGEDDGQQDDWAHCVSYVFVDHLAAQHAFLLLVVLHEGYFYEWIDDRTGTTTRIEDEPHFSPSGERFVVVHANDTNFNALQVWERRDGEFVKDWEQEIKASTLYTFQRWDGEDAVILEMTIDVNGKPAEKLPVRLVRLSAWTIKSPPELPRHR